MSHSSSADLGYVPALGNAGLTPLYDSAMATIFQEWRFRTPLVNAVSQAVAAKPDAVIVEVGSGTATVSLQVQAAAPAASVIATEIDAAIMVRACAKAAAAASPLRFCAASATSLPLDDASVDAVVSSLMFHHLTTAQKRAMLEECRRVLRQGSALFILDFGPPSSPVLAEVASLLCGGFEHVDINLAGGVAPMLVDAGFEAVTVDAIAFGGLVRLYCGRRP